MSRLTSALIVLSFVAATAASAQTGGAGAGAGGAKGGVWPAPVGHRQPTQSDLRSTGGNNQNAIDADDKALDKKIKSICKGC
ncbi:MAG: hypothetical protein P4M07_23360 [Xanthobacteraceae bacterium]|jgi:hypothetical protein|nr:hypothetical protein [Xanthobacteraceae bacterium]